MTSLYPTVIFEDRYGRGWIAVAEACLPGRDLLALGEADEGPMGGDNEAWEWHDAIPIWAAVGKTPNDALERLKAKSVGVSADI
jgi:hypothetical protein